MQRVLQIVNIMDRGGVETLLMNIYRKINRNILQFDFLTHPYNQEQVFEYESEILSMGGKVYKAPSFSHNPKVYTEYISHFFSHHTEYDVIHAHNLDSAALVYMNIIKQGKNRTLIAHSHNTNDHGGIAKRVILRQCRRLIRPYPDYYFACSYEAAVYAFGKKIADSIFCHILYNGIDTSQYHVDEISHIEARNSLFPHVKGPIFGTVGRLLQQKNHVFLLDVFYEILKYEHDAMLVIVGKGNLLNFLKAKACRLGIEDHVVFAGSVSDVSVYYKAFDVFLFPSLYEGLPLAVLEAQAAGLPTILSDEISSSVKCTGKIQFIPLSFGAEAWAKVAYDAWLETRGKRIDCVGQVCAAGFDIVQTAEWLSTFYSTCKKRNI